MENLDLKKAMAILMAMDPNKAADVLTGVLTSPSAVRSRFLLQIAVVGSAPRQDGLHVTCACCMDSFATVAAEHHASLASMGRPYGNDFRNLESSSHVMAVKPSMPDVLSLCMQPLKASCSCLLHLVDPMGHAPACRDGCVPGGEQVGADGCGCAQLHH
jgi:hypothetical protein